MPNEKLLALVLAFAAVGGLVATGAFTSVEAERTADVSVGGDQDALLGLDPIDRSSFVQNADTSSDTFEIDLADDQLNTNGTTNAGPVVSVTNNGQNTVQLVVNVSGGIISSDDVDVAFYTNDSGVSTGDTDPISVDTVIDEYNAFFDSTDYLISSTQNSDPTNVADSRVIELDSGESFDAHLAIQIDDPDGSIELSGTTLFDTVTFLATSNGELTSDSPGLTVDS
ncbi:MAG: hypothetical protein J07HX5_01661 [halophilic archaeon J07HX5]|jgi:Protein of unknown function (DUF1102).|nr:MAG: hypothetical protein J07HX5_01661 [halophilic archaeon J07HX5]